MLQYVACIYQKHSQLSVSLSSHFKSLSLLLHFTFFITRMLDL